MNATYDFNLAMVILADGLLTSEFCACRTVLTMLIMLISRLVLNNALKQINPPRPPYALGASTKRAPCTGTTVHRADKTSMTIKYIIRLTDLKRSCTPELLQSGPSVARTAVHRGGYKECPLSTVPAGPPVAIQEVPGLGKVVHS